MKTIKLFSIISLLFIGSAEANWQAESEEVSVLEIPEDCHLVGAGLFGRATSDAYLEAYLQGVLDTKYPDSGCTVALRNGNILLINLPADKNRAQSMVDFVRVLTKRSVVDTTLASQKTEPIADKGWHGVWLPQSTVLFPSEIANPRQVMFSVGGRFSDRIGGAFASTVTFGDQFPIYRWANLWGGDLQLEVEGAAFAVFELSDRLFPLINTDYYGGIPLTFAKGPFAYRLRLYHISSHLGDEYMQAHRHCRRKNKSFEALDFSIDYQISKKLRLYGILGSIFASDKEMRMKPFYIEYGFETRGTRTDFKQLFGQPFFAVHARNYQDVGYALDTTCALGYEWGKIHGIGRKIRIFAEYHHGYSPEGQFSRIKTQYIGLRIAYGF